jgi:hypothetical protein
MCSGVACRCSGRAQEAGKWAESGGVGVANESPFVRFFGGSRIGVSHA